MSMFEFPTIDDIRALGWYEPVISIFDNTIALPVGPSIGDRYIALVTANGWIQTFIYEWNGGSWDATVTLLGGKCVTTIDDDTYVKNTATTWVKQESVIDDFLRLDGSNAMIGDLDVDNNDIIDPSYIYNAAGFHLGISGSLPNLLIPSTGHGIYLDPTDRIFTSVPTSFIIANNTYTLNHANATVGSAVQFSPTVNFQQSGNPFGSSALFYNAATFSNVSGIAINMGLMYSLICLPTIQADNGVVSGSVVSYFDSPLFKGINGGTLNVSTWTTIRSAGTIQAGATITERYGLYYAQSGVTGTLNNQTAIVIEDLTSSISSIGIQSLMNTGYFISHTGSAPSDIGGHVRLTGTLTKLPVKTTTGDPGSPEEGDIYVNTFDRVLRLYANAAWRTISSW